MIVTTRRYRACTGTTASTVGSDIEIAQTDQGELATFAGRSIEECTVRCTLVDIGDPRFRAWLVGALVERMQRPLRLRLDIGG